VQDLTEVDAALDIWLSGTTNNLQNVAAQGGFVRVLASDPSGQLLVTDYSHDGPGSGILVSARAEVEVSRSQFSSCDSAISAEGDQARVTISDSSIANCATGISVGPWSSLTVSDTAITGGEVGLQSRDGTLAATGVTIDGCDRAINVGSVYGSYTEAHVTVAVSTLTDNRIGALINGANGGLTMTDVVIRDDEGTPQAVDHGVIVGSGYAYMYGVTIAGHSGTGVAASLSSETSAGLLLDGVLIEGGERGVHVHAGVADYAWMGITGSTVRDRPSPR
jgi:hypothetical protein